MQITLYKVIDSDNVIGKQLIDGVDYDVRLRRDFDISAPVIPLMVNSRLDVTEFNYLTIPDINRFYFIDSIQNLARNVWQLSCRCDVLESFKVDILASNAQFRRPYKSGDKWGNFEITGLKTITHIDSDKSMPAGGALILSTVGA